MANIISSTVIALAIIACTTALGLHGTLDASAVTGILGTVAGIAGGTAAVKAGARIANGKEH